MQDRCPEAMGHHFHSVSGLDADHPKFQPDESQTASEGGMFLAALVHNLSQHTEEYAQHRGYQTLDWSWHRISDL